jgi:hypothetical protein
MNLKFEVASEHQTNDDRVLWRKIQEAEDQATEIASYHEDSSQLISLFHVSKFRGVGPFIPRTETNFAQVFHSQAKWLEINYGRGGNKELTAIYIFKIDNSAVHQRNNYIHPEYSLDRIIEQGYYIELPLKYFNGSYILDNDQHLQDR